MKRRREGVFPIDCEFASTLRPNLFTTVPRMWVDPDSQFTWIPRNLLRRAGIKPVKKTTDLILADGQAIRRSIGYAIVRAGGFETIDEVVFAEHGDHALLGGRTLVGFGARVDPRLKRLIASGPHPAALAGTLC